MKKIVIVSWFFCLFLAAAGQPQPATITGNAPGAEGKTVRFYVLGDLITFTEELVASAVVDTAGNFTLVADVGETRLIVLEIDFHRTDFWVEPGKTYTLRVAPMDYNAVKEVNPFIASQSLQADLVNPGLNELNIWIENYNAKYDQYLLDHFNQLYLERNRALVDTFKFTINFMFREVDIPYYKDYMMFKTAGLEQLSKALSPYKLVRRYFWDRPILYQNTEYMNFFNSYFNRYMSATSYVLKKLDMPALLNGPSPFGTLMKKAAADTILKDEPLRELVVLKGLMELYFSNAQVRPRVIAAVKEAETACKSPGNAKVAHNITLLLTRLQPGTAAPEFTLGDSDRNPVSLGAMKGKPVLLCFWTTYCQGCLSEMEGMASLWQKYKDKMEFVNISADRDFVMMKYFIDKKPNYTWKFLHIGEHWEILKAYDVRSYPLFVLIDRQGNLFRRYPAPIPSEGLEALLEELTAQ